MVEKAKIAADGGYNLSGERYRENGVRSSRSPIVSLGDVAKVIAGQSPPGASYNGAGIGTPFYQGKTEFGEVFIGGPVKWTTDPRRFADEGDILISVRAPVGPVNLALSRICIGRGLAAIQPDNDRLLTLYAFQVLRSLEAEITGNTGAAFASINKRQIENVPIPLPPLEAQREIIAEIEGYQKVIDGARAVIENYRPHIHIDPEWPQVKLGDALRTSSGGTPSRRKSEYYVNGTIPWFKSGEVAAGILTQSEEHITEDGLANSSAKIFPAGTVLVAMYGATVGKVGLLGINAATNQAICGILPTDSVVPKFLFYHLSERENEMIRRSFGGAQPNISQAIVRSFSIPIPPFSTQRSLVAELESEEALVNANRELIGRFEEKIHAAIDRVWGDG